MTYYTYAIAIYYLLYSNYIAAETCTLLLNIEYDNNNGYIYKVHIHIQWLSQCSYCDDSTSSDTHTLNE